VGASRCRAHVLVALVSFQCVSPHSLVFFLIVRPPPRPTLFPYTTLFRSSVRSIAGPRNANDDVRAATCRPGSWVRALMISSAMRSEEHTSELQSRGHLVCRLLLEKKK